MYIELILFFIVMVRVTVVILPRIVNDIIVIIYYAARLVMRIINDY